MAINVAETIENIVNELRRLQGIEVQVAEALRKHGLTLVKTAAGYDVLKLGEITAQSQKKSPEQSDLSAVHLHHCNIGEYVGSCKYGEDDCPAMDDAQEPVAYWIPKAEQFCIADPNGRPFAKAWEPLYTSPQPAPQQEPVAKVCHDLDGHIGWNPNLRQLPDEGAALYTSPPEQRKPLTDEQIWKFWWSRPEVPEGEDDSMEAEFVAAVRAVLAAHGIKENT